MKIGEYKVKRNYSIPQMVLDVFSVMILVVIVQCFVAFTEEIAYYNSILNRRIEEETVITDMTLTWLPAIIWLICAVAVIAVSLFFQYRKKKLPKKYVINAENVQKYNDIYQTAVSCIRIIALLAVFEFLYLHSQFILGFTEWFSLQIILDILLIIIIVQFSKHRVRAIQPKVEEEERTIIQD